MMVSAWMLRIRATVVLMERGRDGRQAENLA